MPNKSKQRRNLTMTIARVSLGHDVPQEPEFPLSFENKRGGMSERQVQHEIRTNVPPELPKIVAYLKTYRENPRLQEVVLAKSHVKRPDLYVRQEPLVTLTQMQKYAAAMVEYDRKNKGRQK